MYTDGQGCSLETFFSPGHNEQRSQHLPVEQQLQQRGRLREATSLFSGELFVYTFNTQTLFNVLDVLAAIKVGSANYFSLLAIVIYLLIVFISIWVCLLGIIYEFS